MNINNLNIFGDNVKFQTSNETLAIEKAKKLYPIGTKIKWSGEFGVDNKFEKGVNRVVGYKVFLGIVNILLDNGKRFHAVAVNDINQKVHSFEVVNKAT